MIKISIEDLQNKLDFYLEKSNDEDVLVVDKNNQAITVLTNPHIYALYELERLIESTDLEEDLSNKSCKELIGECISEKYNIN